MKKYWQFFYIEYVNGFYYRSVIFGRIAFYGLLLFIFSRLWLMTAKYNQSFSTQEMVWYLALTELIVLSFPLVHVEIEEDVRSGNLSYFLLRPASYFWSRYFRALGGAFSRVTVMAAAGFFYAWAFVGLLPDSSGLWLVLPMGALAILVTTLYHVTIGITAFWLQDSSPLYWVWQKMYFILGGLILPMSLYPTWLLRIARLTPFPYLLHFPVSLCLRPDSRMLILSVFFLLVWGVIGVLLGTIVFQKACKELAINGG